MWKLIMLVGLAAALVGCGGNPPSSVAFSAIPEEGDVDSGAKLFEQATNGSTPCTACHAEGAVAAPDLAGYGAVAGDRVEGESAREYTFYSIVEPGRYLVEGYGNAMPNNYDELLEPQDIADLIAYLLSL